MVRLRLTRMGRRHRPFYRLNAVEKRTQRDGRVLENLGWYNPMEKDVSKQAELKSDRIKHWLSQGAQPSDTVKDLLARHEVIDAAAWTAERESKRRKNYEAAVARKQADEAAKRAEEEAAKKAADEASAASEGDSSQADNGASEG